MKESIKRIEMVSMNAYEEKINAKIEHAEQRAVQLKNSSERFFKNGFCETTGIPLGQPILIGHHSENRHRNAIKKYENQIKNAIKDSEKSEYYESKAERLKNNSVISSDNPQAIDLLLSKIGRLEKNALFCKDLNAKFRKFKTRQNALIEVAKLPEENPDKNHFNMMLDQARYYAIPPDRINSYYLNTTSDNAEIRRLKDRVKELQQKDKIKDGDIETGVNKIVINKELNRVQILFNDIPEKDIRTKLKQNGFHWSPYNKAWQRVLNEISLSRAKNILNQEVF